MAYTLVLQRGLSSGLVMYLEGCLTLGKLTKREEVYALSRRSVPKERPARRRIRSHMSQTSFS